jgi:hypothetical protein
LSTIRPVPPTSKFARQYQAAQRVFDDAGVDPVEAGYQDSDDPQRREYLAKLWEIAQHAAAETCWAPRGGPPEPTVLDIYVE